MDDAEENVDMIVNGSHYKKTNFKKSNRAIVSFYHGIVDLVLNGESEFAEMTFSSSKISFKFEDAEISISGDTVGNYAERIYDHVNGMMNRFNIEIT